MYAFSFQNLFSNFDTLPNILSGRNFLLIKKDFQSIEMQNVR